MGDIPLPAFANTFGMLPLALVAATLGSGCVWKRRGRGGRGMYSENCSGGSDGGSGGVNSGGGKHGGGVLVPNFN